MCTWANKMYKINVYHAVYRKRITVQAIFVELSVFTIYTYCTNGLRNALSFFVNRAARKWWVIVYNGETIKTTLSASE